MNSNYIRSVHKSATISERLNLEPKKKTPTHKPYMAVNGFRKHFEHRTFQANVSNSVTPNVIKLEFFV